jgi:membrane protein YqaA with SNARE-associated domain
MMNKSSNKIRLEKIKSSKPFISLLYVIAPLRRIIKKLYSWTMKWATHKHATAALAGLSFAEASFFPLPVDPLLMTMIFATPKRWLKLVAITVGASVIGAIFGYFIGAVLFDSIGQWITNTLHLEHQFETVRQYYQDYSFFVIITAAFTPLPFKVFTISAGLFSVNFWGFVLASIVGRTLRFGIVGGLAYFLGKKYKDQIEKYVDVISLGFLALIMFSYVMYKLLAT